MAKRSVAELDVKGRRVLVRVDFNVPINAAGGIDDDTRIRASLPTIENLCERGAKVIVMSHLGRPKDGPEPQYSLAPAAKRLAGLLRRPVAFADDCMGPSVEAAAGKLAAGEVLLLENLRFHKEETANDPGFAAALARLADLYVDDAFGAAHRAHASTEGVARLLPNAAGFLMLRELEFLSEKLRRPAEPFIAILGGAKVSDKIGVITNLLSKVNAVIVGGGMAYTFLAAQGRRVGSSKLEADKIDLAADILKKAKEKGVDIMLPCDHVVSDRFGEGGTIKTVAGDVPDGFMGLDIGPRTRDDFRRAIAGARTVVWNGPMGVFETAAFSAGTEAVAEAVAALGGMTIAGGGDTVSALAKLGLTDKLSHVSTGGGASLELLEGKALPGVEVLAEAGHIQMGRRRG